ncbi:hypothetical protein IIZ77_02740 [Candidatus Saccharibacteria bacterium]|nr:hypothetical protein [Candidatus Saccharibacteria bacterium]
MCLVILTKYRDAHLHEMDRGNLTEEELARLMAGEYPQYKQLFRDQASAKLMMPLSHF